MICGGFADYNEGLTLPPDSFLCFWSVSLSLYIYIIIYISVCVCVRVCVCVCAIQWLARSQGGRGIHIGIHINGIHISYSSFFMGSQLELVRVSQPNHMIGLNDVKWHVRLSGSDAKAEQLAGSWWIEELVGRVPSIHGSSKSWLSPE